MTVESVLIALLFLLPGAHARQTTLRATPLPWSSSYRSVLQELVEVLSYAAVNAVVTLASVAAVAVAFFGQGQNLEVLLTKGLEGFAPDRRLDGLVWAAFYLLVALLVAELTGSAQVWARTRTFLAELLAYSDTWTHSTIWYHAMEGARGEDLNGEVSVLLRLRDGSDYVGLLDEYPVIEDDKCKDFSLRDARRRETGTTTFVPVTPASSVLLCSNECQFIHVGPNGRPKDTRPTDVRKLVLQGSVWVLLLLLSGATEEQLRQLPRDDLLRLLEVTALWGATTGFFGFLRLILRDLLRQWDRPTVQMWWLVAGAAGVLASLLFALDVELLVLVIALVGVVALVLLVAEVVRQSR